MSGRRVAALVLAAGRSSRMGATNKLLATFDGVPLVRRTTERALAASAAPIFVVLGHQADAVRAALEGLDVTIVENEAYADGLSTSLRLGFARAASSGADGVLVLLADQPAVTSAHIDRMVEAFQALPEPDIVVATDGKMLGNPVLLPANLAGDIASLRGDRGARRFLDGRLDRLVRVDIGPAALLDVDTLEALTDAGGAPAAAALPRRS